jgi:hypothetical protein
VHWFAPHGPLMQALGGRRMYLKTIFVLTLMFLCVNCYATEVSDSITQFNAKCPAQKLGPIIDNYYHEKEKKRVTS